MAQITPFIKWMFIFNTDKEVRLEHQTRNLIDGEKPSFSTPFEGEIISRVVDYGKHWPSIREAMRYYKDNQFTDGDKIVSKIYIETGI